MNGFLKTVVLINSFSATCTTSLLFPPSCQYTPPRCPNSVNPTVFSKKLQLQATLSRQALIRSVSSLARSSHGVLVSLHMVPWFMDLWRALSLRLAYRSFRLFCLH